MFASALLATGALVAAAAPATADPQPICTLLAVLCPTTTVKPPPTTVATKGPAPTTAPAHTTTPTTKTATKVVASTSTTTRPGGQLQVGVGAVAGAPAIDPAALNQPVSAPELAGTGTPTGGTTTPSDAALGGTQPAALGAAAGRGLPNHHATLRVLLSLGALGIAGLAAAQLPVSRRRRRLDSPADGLDIIDGL